MNTTSNCTTECDRCGRGLSGKSYIIIDGMNICGVCQFEVNENGIKDSGI